MVNFCGVGFVKISLGLYSLMAILLLCGAINAEYMVVNAPAAAGNLTNVTITGYVYQTNSTTGANAVPITIILNSTSNVSSTGSDGNFSVMVQTPNTRYDTNLTVNTSNVSKLIQMRITPITNCTAFLQGVSNVSAGSNFSLNVSALALDGGNVTNDSPGTTMVPIVSVFNSEGALQTYWNTQNTTPNDGGHTLFNISSPSNATGSYIIVFERGACAFPVYISSGTTVSVSTEINGTNSTATDFYPSSTVVIVAKFRNSAGNPVTGLSPTAYVTLPNGTLTSVSLTTTEAGTYKGNFATTSTSGTYQYTVSASVSGIIAGMGSSFGIKYFNAMLVEDTNSFITWSGSGAYVGGSNAVFLLSILNLSNGTIISGTTTGEAAKVRCNETRLMEVTAFGNSSSINASIAATFQGNSTGTYYSTSICRLNFSAPIAAGSYLLKVNINHSGQMIMAEKTFNVQNYMLQVAPVNSFGWSFKQTFTPLTNASFTLSAYNASNATQLTGANITSIAVTSLMNPLTGQQLALPTYYAPTNGLGLLNVTIPNQTGPMVLTVQAVVGGSTVSTSAFFFANYLEGWAFPTAGGEMGPGAEFNAVYCSGNATFMAMVKDAATSELVTGAIISGVRILKKESTGEDKTSCVLNMTNGVTSGSSGGSFTLSFDPSCSLSGFHFMLVNVSYNGNVDAIPTGFMCGQFDISPTVYNEQGQFAWKLAPNTNITINITNATILSNNSVLATGNISAVRLMTFNPATGEQVYNSNALVSADIANGIGSLVIHPQNFSSSSALSAWPNGFMEIQVQICNADGGACGEGSTGVQITPFDAFIQNAFMGPPEQYVTGQNVSLTVNVRANVTRGGNIIGEAGFQVMLGKPWEGEMSIVPNYVNGSSSLLVDGWNSSSDWGYEEWNVTFNIPTTISTGETMAMITVTANTSGMVESTQTETFFSAQKFAVFVPTEQFVEMGMGYRNLEWDNQTLLDEGWNLTNISEELFVNSSDGVVFTKRNFNVTSYGNAGTSSTITYNANASIMLLNVNSGQGICDTVIFRNLTGNNAYVILNLTDLSRRNITSGGLYLWSIEGCWSIKIFNSTQNTSSSGWIGTHELGTNITIPYIVRKSVSETMANTTVGVDSIVEQNLQGFGMQAGINTTNYSLVEGLTNHHGVAFMVLNISYPGRLMLFWKANSSSESDMASFASGSSFESRRFQSEVYSTTIQTNNSITLYKKQEWGWLNTSETYEGVASNFYYMQPLYMAMDFSTNLTRLDDDSNATSGGTVLFLNFTGANSVNQTPQEPIQGSDSLATIWKAVTAITTPTYFKIGGLDQYNKSALVSDPIYLSDGTAENAIGAITFGQNITEGDYYNLSIERSPVIPLSDETVGLAPYLSNVSLWWNETNNASQGNCNESAGASSTVLVRILSNSSQASPFNVSVLDPANVSITIPTTMLYYDLRTNRTYVMLTNSSNNNAPLGCFVVARNSTANTSKIYYYVQQGSDRFDDTNPPQEQVSVLNYSDLGMHEVRVSEYVGASVNYTAYLRVYLNATFNFTELNYTNSTGIIFNYSTIGNTTERGSKIHLFEKGQDTAGRVHLNMTRRISGKTLRFYPQSVREVLDVSGDTAYDKVQILANEYTEAGAYYETSCMGNINTCYINGTESITLNASAPNFQWDTGVRLKAVSMIKNTTEAQIAFVQESWGGMGMNNVNSSDTNVSIMACPKTFAKPQGMPIFDAVVMNATTMNYQMNGPPTTAALQLVHPINNSVVSNISVGPSGCAALKISNPNGWTMGMPSEIQLTIKRLSDDNSETVWGGMVMYNPGGGGQGGGPG